MIISIYIEDIYVFALSLRRRLGERRELVLNSDNKWEQLIHKVASVIENKYIERCKQLGLFVKPHLVKILSQI